MPNYCYNILRLEHSDQSKLQEALDHFNKEELLAYFLPEPDYENTNAAELIYKSRIDPELEAKVQLVWEYMKNSDAGKSGHMPDWWVWRNKNWGTKWDIYDPCYPNNNPPKIENGWIELGFSTAWSPPLRAYAAAAERHGFKITACYYEPNMCFCGEYQVPDKKDLYIDYAEDRVEIPKHLDEMFGITEWLKEPEESDSE